MAMKKWYAMWLPAGVAAFCTLAASVTGNATEHSQTMDWASTSVEGHLLQIRMDPLEHEVPSWRGSVHAREEEFKRRTALLDKERKGLSAKDSHPSGTGNIDVHGIPPDTESSGDAEDTGTSAGYPAGKLASDPLEQVDLFTQSVPEKSPQSPERSATPIRTCGIPEKWFEDKAKMGHASRSVIYHRLEHRHRKIGNFPAAYIGGFSERPSNLNVYIGEAYFVDHCLNHHPEVKDDIYRQIQNILDSPEEVVIDDNGQVLLFVKRLQGTRYVLVLRHYGGAQGQIVYKTLYPTDKEVKPMLPRASPVR